MIQDNILKIYPFIIDGIEDARDSHFSIYKKITANGMAFSELGKTGYKLELNSHTVESELEENKNLLPTINYWLDKVFPNRKDENGDIVEWLTPWCYEIRMDWSHYAASKRDTTKIYEDDYISSWTVKEESENTAAALVPAEKTIGKEKGRYIDCSNSNKYNITQTLAETFGVFCVYEYKCDEHGQFISQYRDENNKLWQGRKVIFYNRAIKTDNPLYIDYQKNLSTISRTADSAELYTKLYVTPIDSTIMSSGLVSIADTPTNPLLDDFILNFDYLYSKGSITEYQWNYVNTYKANLRKINLTLKEISPAIEELTAGINEIEAKIAILQKEIESAQKTLTEYETLKNNEATNGSITKDKTNTYSIIFIKEDNCYSASIRLQGIDVSSISGYEDYKYEKKAFSIAEDSLIISSKKPNSITDNTKFYVLLDEYGYPNEIYASLQNSKIYKGEKENPHTSFYLELTYSPANAYASICSTLQDTITAKTRRKEALESDLEEDQAKLEKKEEEYTSSSKDKEELNRKFELMMGPALREGYWTPEAYDDPGEGITIDLTEFKTFEDKDGNVSLNNSVHLFYDKVLFNEEETGYYYDNPLKLEESNRKYYPFIRYSELNDTIKNSASLQNLVLHLYDVYERKASNNIEPGWYYALINGTKYFIDLSNKEAIEQGTKLIITYATTNLGRIALYCNNGEKVDYITDFQLPSSIDEENRPTNPPPLNGKDEDSSIKLLRQRTLYNNAGYVFSFIKEKAAGNIVPVLLLNDSTIPYEGYSDKIIDDTDGSVIESYTVRIAYDFSNSEIDTTALLDAVPVYPTDGGGDENNYIVYYPRVVLNNQNVNYQSDLLTISTYSDKTYNENNAKLLTKFIDYNILLRDGKPYITLKITENHTINNILNSNYHIFYQISRANEMLYLDAKEVAYENSRPRYTYSLSVANLPDYAKDTKTSKIAELGQLVYISDYSLGIHAATGYISGITLSLAKPQEDSLTIQNYKTKFEDLFSTITASSEAMKNNKASYDIAAAAFTGNGQIAGSVLEQSISNSNISFNFSGTNVEISPTDGIILTNTTPYLNGVYGQVALRGGGVFLSDSIDGAGARIWSTAITPSGLNASLITSGQLNTESIRIFAGSNMAFQWNGEGIFAYKRDEENDGAPDMTTYVKYSQHGLQYIQGAATIVDLGWNGLLISTQEGATELTGKDGLVVYNGQKESNGSNKVIQIGRLNEEKNQYGMRLLRPIKNSEGEEVYTETLVADNTGSLWLKDDLRVGDSGGMAGITGSGATEYDDDKNIVSSPIRFWAGRIANSPEPLFWVKEDGSLKATKANIEGTITAKSGSIGGWIIDGDTIKASNIILQGGENAQISVSGSGGDITISNDGLLTANGATINGTIYADGGSIGNLDVVDIKALGGNLNNITVRISTDDSLTYKTNTKATISFTAKALRGNIPFSFELEKDGKIINEYSAYKLIWQYKYNSATNWEQYIKENIANENDLKWELAVSVNEPIYVKCDLVEIKPSEGGGNI